MAWRKDTAYHKDLLLDDFDVDDLTYDASFVLDPAKLYDDLPQPFRLIDKTVDYVFDKAWEAIQEIELRATELGLGGKLPVFDHAEELSDFPQATLMCSSLDGKHLFVVAKNGVIYALDAKASCLIAYNDELQGMNMKTLSTGCLEEDKHLVCAQLENGTAVICALSGSNLHVLRVFNEDAGVKGSVTSYINISFDGNYLALGWRIPLKSTWLEIYKIPKEFWCNEISIIEEKLVGSLEQETSTKVEDETVKVANGSLVNDSSDSENESAESRPNSLSQSGAQAGHLNETSFTKPSLILKIKAPTEPSPNPANNVTSALKSIDQDYDVIGTGTNHVLLQSYFNHSDKVFTESHLENLQYLAEKEQDDSTRLPKVLFLTPGRFVSTAMQTAPGQVNSILVHWSEASHGLIYSLVKASKEVEHKPDVVLTASSKILVSDVSLCKSLISFATENHNIITWDKLTGLPLAIVNLSNTSTITALYFIPTTKETCCMTSLPKLIVCCADGGLYIVEYGEDGETTTVDLPSSSFKMSDPVVQVSSLLNLPQLVITQRKSGQIMLLDILTQTLKCQVVLVKSLTMLNGFCYSQATSTLYMKGGRKDEYNEEILPESVCVYKIKVDSLSVIRTYVKDRSKVSAETIRTMEGFDKRIASIVQERVSSYEKRERNHETRWRQLENELNRMKRPATLGQSLWFTETIGV